MYIAKPLSASLKGVFGGAQRNTFIETIVMHFLLKCLFSMKIEKPFPIDFNIFYDL